VINSKTDLKTWMHATRERVNLALEGSILRLDVTSDQLKKAMLYAVKGGGKRVRPMLAYAASELSEDGGEILDDVCVAIELVHIYSLIHDDLPCIDDDSLRHGKPTLHKKYGEAWAILTGDALHTLAFETLSNIDMGDNEIQKIELIQKLAKAAGPMGMVDGQCLDLQLVGCSSSLEKLTKMHGLKTGEMIVAATEMGGICVPSLSNEERQALTHFAKKIGLAFQVVDDILDAESNTDTLGKTAGKDKRDNKPNFVELMSVSGAKEYAETLKIDATQHLKKFSKRANRLVELATYIISRTY